MVPPAPMRARVPAAAIRRSGMSYELLRRCSARLDGAHKEDQDRLAGELKKLSGIAGRLTELVEGEPDPCRRR